ncbi:hypothetical protein G5V59_00810 [Nocardioides sp. W3-2-3]|nr:hypothetical protein [Nocardioides convexus]NGZ99469.1 hypothetical protein [Nocardioides convexus]
MGRNAHLLLEVGCWAPEVSPEPDGGAVDCPLLFDVPLRDVVDDTTHLLDLVTGIGDLATLGQRLDEFVGGAGGQGAARALGLSRAQTSWESRPVSTS